MIYPVLILPFICLCNEYFSACNVYGDILFQIWSRLYADFVMCTWFFVVCCYKLVCMFAWHLLYPAGFLSFMGLWNVWVVKKNYNGPVYHRDMKLVEHMLVQEWQSVVEIVLVYSRCNHCSLFLSVHGLSTDDWCWGWGWKGWVIGSGYGEIQFQILQVHTTCSMKCSIFCSVRTVIIHLLLAWESGT